MVLKASSEGGLDALKFAIRGLQANLNEGREPGTEVTINVIRTSVG